MTLRWPIHNDFQMTNKTSKWYSVKAWKLDKRYVDVKTPRAVTCDKRAADVDTHVNGWVGEN